MTSAHFTAGDLIRRGRNLNIAPRRASFNLRLRFVRRPAPHLDHYAFSCLDAAAATVHLAVKLQLSVPCSRAFVFRLLREEKSVQPHVESTPTCLHSRPRAVALEDQREGDVLTCACLKCELHPSTIFPTRFHLTVFHASSQQPADSAFVFPKRSGSSQEEVLLCFLTFSLISCYYPALTFSPPRNLRDLTFAFTLLTSFQLRPSSRNVSRL